MAQPRVSPYPMVAVETAQQLIQQQMTPLHTETITITAAHRRILGEDVIATAALPDTPRSLVDGYALRAEDGLAPRQLMDAVRPSAADTPMVQGMSALRINTGAPIPPGADAVIMIEQTIEEQGMLRLHHAVTPGQHIRPAGSDVMPGTTLLTRGTPLGAAAIGLLISAGYAQVAVYRRPRVAILSTGNEIIEPDAPYAPGMVYDSNRYALLAAVAEADCEGISLGIAPDHGDTQRAALLHGLSVSDVLITSGGVSMGQRDLIKPLLAELGTIHFGRTAAKPGKPVTFATVNQQPVFALPGNPVSSLVAFELFVRPALRRLQGDRQPERPRYPVVLAETIAAPDDRTEYHRAAVVRQQGQLLVASTGEQRSSSRLLSLQSANALLIVPPAAAPYAVGSVLEALLLDFPDC